jgi:hypothetical protein
VTPDEARRLLEERRRLDPVRQFFERYASPEHIAVCSSTAQYQYIDAPNRSGKTTCMLMEAAAYLRGIHPFRPKPQSGPVRILMIAPSRAQLATIFKKRLLERSDLRSPDEPELAKRPMIPPHEIRRTKAGKPDITYTESPQGKALGRLALVDGSEMFFCVSGDPNGWQRVMGNDYHAVFRDESVGNDNLTPEIITRLLDHQQRPDEPHAGFYKWGCTELVITNELTEFKAKCGAPRHDGTPRDPVEGHHYVKLSPQANPSITMAAREKMALALGDEAAAVRLFGTAALGAGLTIYGRQWSSSRHILAEDYTPGPLDNLWVGWDPGWDHPYGIGIFAINRDAPLQLRFIRFHTGRHMTLEQQAHGLAQWLDGRFLEGWISDPAAKKTEHNRGLSLATQMEQLIEGMHVRINRGFLFGRNRYEDTIPLVQRYLDPDSGNARATPLLVFNPTADGMGQAIEQMVGYRVRPKSNGQARGYNIHKENDTAPDIVRYVISRQPAWAERDPNHAKTIHPVPAYGQLPQRRTPEPLAITPDMDEAQRVHVMRLRESSRMISSMMTGVGMESMAVEIGLGGL